MEKGFIQYDSIDMARHIITKCKERDINDIGNTKINKLLYCVYGVYLALYDNEILTEQPKYFPYGPVFPRVFKKYDEIKNNILNINLDKETRDVVDFVLKTFGKVSAGNLSDWSHSKNSPWDKMKQNGAKYSDALNPIDIRNYFINFLKLKNANK